MKLLAHLCHDDFPWVLYPQIPCHFKFSQKFLIFSEITFKSRRNW